MDENKIFENTVDNAVESTKIENAIPKEELSTGQKVLKLVLDILKFVAFAVVFGYLSQSATVGILFALFLTNILNKRNKLTTEGENGESCNSYG